MRSHYKSRVLDLTKISLDDYLEDIKEIIAEYTGLWNTTHTGLLVGQRYMEVVDRIMEWLKMF